MLTRYLPLALSAVFISCATVAVVRYGRARRHLPWLGWLSAVALCLLFHLHPACSPEVLANQAETAADTFLGVNPYLSFLGPHPWLVIAVGCSFLAVPLLVKWNGLAFNAAPSPLPAKLVRDLPLPAARVRALAKLWSLVAGMVGRINCGKSELLDQAVLGDGVHPHSRHARIGVEDPRLLAELQATRREWNAALKTGDRETTRSRVTVPIALFQNGRAVLDLTVTDPVGQLVSFTTPHAPADILRRWDRYMDQLAGSAVLWMTVACPPRNCTPEEQRTFLDDLELTSNYVRAVLERRPDDRKLSLAIVLTRIDSRYDTKEDAIARLPRELLRPISGRMAPMLAHPALGEVALIPVSSWGFGNAVVDAAAPTDHLHRAGDRAYRLAPGAEPRPFNVTALVLWSMAAAAGSLPAADTQAERDAEAQVHNELRDELADGRRHWVIQL